MRSSRLHRAHVLGTLVTLFCFVFSLAQPTIARAQNGTVSGTVTGYVGSQTVQVSAQAPGSMNVYTANATPNYSLSLPAGLYNVSVTNPTSGWYISPTRYSVDVGVGSNTPGRNFTMTPVGNSYTIAGYVYISATTCPGVSGATYVTVNISGNGYSSSQDVIIPVGASSGQYQFLNLPVFGYYTVSVAPSSGVSGGDSIQAITTTGLYYNQNLIATRSTFNICGYVTQFNGQPAPGTVYIFYGPGLDVQSATVQSNGAYTFQNVPPNIWGVFMLDTAQWNYAPSWPQFQYAYVITSDVDNIDFSANANVSTVTGNFSGLPNGAFGSVYLYKWIGNSWSFFGSASTKGTVPWSIPNVSAGTYFVLPGAPPATGDITPVFLGPFTVTPSVASTVNAGTFNYVVTGSGQLQAAAFTSPQMSWIQTLNSSPVLTITGQYINDTYTVYLGNGSMYLYPPWAPQNISMNLHPGSYTWTMTGQSPLNVTQPTGSFTINAKQTTNIGSFIFTLPGPSVNFTPNPCNSAVCSSGGPSGTAQIKVAPGAKLAGTWSMPGSAISSPSPTGSSLLHPMDDTTTCTTTPTADVASKSEKLGATPHASVSLATAGSVSSGATTTTTGACSSGVDFTTVPTIDFNGGFGPPDPNNPGYNQQDSTVPASNTTVQFSGVIYATVDGTYQFQTTTNGPITLTVNNTSLINSWTDIQQTQTGSVYLTGGHQYPFTLSYAYDSVTSAQVNLSWQQPTDSAINTIASNFYDQASTLVPLNDLTLQQFGQIVDNYTTGDPNDQQNALAAGYTVARTEGCVYSDQQNGTVPLYVYTNGTDNLSTATPAGQSIAAAGNYVNNGLAGYIYPTPLTDGSSVPLQNWFGNSDYYATASPGGISAAQQAGYVFIQTEGYVLPANSCQ